MKYFVSGLIIVVFCVILVFGGCTEKSVDDQISITTNEVVYSSSEGEDDMKNSVEMLRDKLKISDARAKGAIEILQQSGVSTQLKKVKMISNKQGIDALVTDINGNVYYLAFDGMGFLELVRKDSAKGEIVYGIIQ